MTVAIAGDLLDPQKYQEAKKIAEQMDFLMRTFHQLEFAQSGRLPLDRGQVNQQLHSRLMIQPMTLEFRF